MRTPTVMTGILACFRIGSAASIASLHRKPTTIRTFASTNWRAASGAACGRAGIVGDFQRYAPVLHGCAAAGALPHLRAENGRGPESGAATPISGFGAGLARKQKSRQMR